MVVFRPPVRKKEVVFPILITALECRLKLGATRSRVDYALEGKEYVSGVEVIDPRLFRIGAVEP